MAVTYGSIRAIAIIVVESYISKNQAKTSFSYLDVKTNARMICLHCELISEQKRLYYWVKDNLTTAFTPLNRKMIVKMKASLSSVTDEPRHIYETDLYAFRQGVAISVLLLVVHGLLSCDTASIESILRNGKEECHWYVFSHWCTISLYAYVVALVFLQHK